MALSKKKTYLKVPKKGADESVAIAHNVPTMPQVPDGMWQKCPECQHTILTDDLGRAKICPNCRYHFRISPKRRIALTFDQRKLEQELFIDDSPNDPLSFPEYLEKKQKVQEITEADEAIVTGTAFIKGTRVACGIMDPFFLMGSMSQVVGEKITKLFEYATENHLPVLLFTASGGARMQEGILSLMQMAKTSNAVKQHSDAGLLYIAVLTDPTTGGVTASFAMEADIILAEPGALIGFAGKRVIEQTIHQKLPDDFQSAEHQLQHGFVDKIVERYELKLILGELLALHGYGKEV